MKSRNAGTTKRAKTMTAERAAEIIAASFEAEIRDVAAGNISVFKMDGSDKTQRVEKVSPEHLVKLVANELMIMSICREEGLPVDAGTTNPGAALCYEGK